MQRGPLGLPYVVELFQGLWDVDPHKQLLMMASAPGIPTSQLIYIIVQDAAESVITLLIGVLGFPSKFVTMCCNVASRLHTNATVS